MEKSLANRLCVKKKLNTLSMEEGSSLSEHIHNFNKVIIDLESIHVNIKDKDKSIILLSFMPYLY